MKLCLARYRDPQLQVVENYPYLFNLRLDICKFRYLNTHFHLINPCPADLIQLYFSSFEAGIANAISSFKWQKIYLFMKNKHVWKLTFCLTEHLSQTILWISASFYFLWNLPETGYRPIRLQQRNGQHLFDQLIKRSRNDYIVAVNFHQRWVFFADFSLNSWSIYMKFCKHSLQLFLRLPRKFLYFKS